MPVVLKPRVGQKLYKADGELIGEVKEVEKGKNFWVRIAKSPSGATTVITNFPHWRQRHGWVVK